jgi:acetolactate synthase-1/2/3 large subunit
MSGNEYIARWIKANGGTHFFYVPVLFPDAMMQMTALGLTPCNVHSEKSAAYMADGYARIARKPGFCGAQAIGGSNLAAGLREPLMAFSPVIAFSGGTAPDVRYRARYQDIDDIPTFASLTKWSGVVEKVERLPDLLDQAYRRAMTGRPGPVHLQIPIFWGGMTVGEFETEAPDDASSRRVELAKSMPSPEALNAAVERLKEAKRPIIVVGTGAVQSGARHVVQGFVLTTGIPYVTGSGAKAVDLDDNPLFAGVVGDYSQECANIAVSEADLVIFVGSNTGSMVTRNWTVPAPNARVIQIDVDATHVGRNYPDTVPLIGDAGLTLRVLRDALEEYAADTGWQARIRELREDYERRQKPLETSDAVPMRPERLCKDVSDALPENGILVVDTGHAGGWLARHLRFRHEDQELIRAAGSLGWSFPASLGAKAAAPDRPVVCFTGDGGILYHLTELETALRYNLPTVTVINNNSSLNQEMFIWGDAPEHAHHWKFCEVDYAGIAKGFGAWSARVDDPADLADALREALASGRPAVIDARTDQRIVVPKSWGPGEGGPYGEAGSQ